VLFNDGRQYQKMVIVGRVGHINGYVYQFGNVHNSKCGCNLGSYVSSGINYGLCISLET
jgi:hypothetical protein